jgi:hypothetical protein
MRLPFWRRRPSQLLLAWSAYWIGLVLITLWPALTAGWRVTQLPHNHGTISAGFNNDVLTATIIDSGRTVWTGSTTLLSLVFLVAIPSLLLWLVWLAGSARTNNAGARAAKNARTPGELHAPEPRIGIVETSASSTSKRPAREES